MPSPEDALRKLLSRRIRELREARGLRQVDLEAETGIAQPMLSQIQSGKRNPSLGNLAKIAEALNVRPAVLLLDPRRKKDRAALEALGEE
ncbi:MAG: helix-turn-helix domain-containing protein [Nannocystaceae bacterium]|nr:helix-turn-helix domain-containing protein [bacterium]